METIRYLIEYDTNIKDKLKNLIFFEVEQMGCPLCPAVGWLGGWIGGYFGIHAPQHVGKRILSAAITASLMSITIIALKSLFNISLCNGEGLTLRNIVQIGIQTLVMGIIYSIGVNDLLNRFLFPPCCKRNG